MKFLFVSGLLPLLNKTEAGFKNVTESAVAARSVSFSSNVSGCKTWPFTILWTANLDDLVLSINLATPATLIPLTNKPTKELELSMISNLSTSAL